MDNTYRTDIGLLAVRIALGVVFIAHGVDKLGDLQGTEQFFASLDIPAAGLMAPLVTFTEILGGGALILGVLTPLAGTALAIDMLVAFATVHASKGFFASDGGYELVMLLGLAALALVVSGPGRLSVDAALKLPGRSPSWSGKAHTAGG
jgi:putative oxidoreductase